MPSPVIKILLVLLAVAIITVTIMIILEVRNPSSHSDALWQYLEASTNSIRSSLGMPVPTADAVSSRGVVGRAVRGVDPPNVAERLAALSAMPSSQHVVTPAQEVVMTGSPSMAPHTCLGAENEVLIEVKNDIGADQLDVSYSFEGVGETTPVLAARVVKVASCGRESVIRQCIPVAPSGRGIRLHTLAYYYDAAEVRNETDASTTPKRPAALREEKRTYPDLLNNESLREPLFASSFVPDISALPDLTV